MGVVEVLPGISGGTIALMTGIYERLVNALSQFGRLHKTNEDRDSIIDALLFLIQLALGMVCGLALSVLMVLDLYHRQERLFWAAIFGIVVGAIVQLVRSVERRELVRYAPFGLVVGVAVVALPDLSVEPPLWLYVLGGIAGFSAWLLPGISGAMMLALLGIWIPMLGAVKHFEITKLALFIAGMAIGFAVLPRIIAYGVRHFREQVIAFFIGLVASTLYRVWPWQSEGGMPEMPSFGAEDQLLGVIVCAIGACAIVMSLVYLADRHAT